MASIVCVGEPFLRFQIATYPHDEREHKSRTEMPVCIIEPRLLYRLALVNSLFETPQRRPSLRRDHMGYID